ncbi:MAG: GNAT family N-acetyltransferase [Ruminococcus sp.]|nr:GNAT family N-acetyltransferase [Ruminococcus sp.]
MNVVFEELKEEDLKECYDLCMTSFGEDFAFSEIEETFRMCKGNPAYRFIVGKLDGKIVAYTSANIFHNLFDGKRPIMTLWYVCVDQTCRRQGIGRQLFDEIERIAMEQNCEIIYFTCLKDNHSAQSFYRSLGYSDDKEKAFVKYYF